MTDAMEPVIRQLLEAPDHRARARVLLKLPDNLVLLCHDILAGALLAASFEAGLDFLDLRATLLRKVRDENGRVPQPLAAALEDSRRRMVRHASGTAEG